MNPSSAVTVFTLLQFWYGTLDVLNLKNFTSCSGMQNNTQMELCQKHVHVRRTCWRHERGIVSSEFMVKVFQAAQLTHERFFTIDHSCKILSGAVTLERKANRLVKNLSSILYFSYSEETSQQQELLSLHVFKTSSNPRM